MSVTSPESVFQTPDSVVIVERTPAHAELEPEKDLGASPVLEGPTTRSGKKRKNSAPVKSTGKKKNKMMPVRSPVRPDTVVDIPVVPQTPTEPTQPPAAQQDLAALLTTGLAGIQTSMGGMETRLGGKIDSLETAVRENERRIEILTTSVKANADDLTDLRRRVDLGDAGLERRVEEMVRSAMSSSMSSSRAHPSLDLSLDPQSGRTAEQTARYWRSRRSLRLWPISGRDLLLAVKSFLVDNLDYTRDFVEDLGQCRVDRVVDPRSKVQQEVVVEFPTPAIRDAIKASGHKLQGKRAGIRMEIPHFLKSDFVVLQSISYRMKMANPDMKRSVKFDDEKLGLFLDVQLPGEEWRRIRPDQARAARDSDPVLRAGPRELSSTMISDALRASTSSSSTSSRTTNGQQSPAGQRPVPPLTGGNASPLL